MAYPNSDKHAQTVKICELCEEDNVKWRCIDCKMCLCEKCKIFHLKVPATAKHQIVTIETPIQDVQRRVVTDNIPCKDHETEMNCLYCKTCNRLVCSECVSTSHIQHEFIQIGKALEEKREHLKGIKANITDDLKLCDLKFKEIQHTMPKYSSNFDESMSNINQKENELKEAISKYSNIQRNRVTAERSKVQNVVKKIEEQVGENRNKFEAILARLETALLSNKGQAIFDTSMAKPVLKLDSLPKRVKKFIPESSVDETTKQIQELFGSFKDVKISTVQVGLQLEVLRTFTTDFIDINQVIPLDESVAWISSGSSWKPVLRKVTIQDNKLVTSKEIPLAINDMALTADNDIFLTVKGENEVKILTKSGEIKSFRSVAPSIPGMIHVTDDNEVIVSVMESITKVTGRIVVFDTDGNQKHMYQSVNIKGVELFTDPYRITTNKNKDILVIQKPFFGTKKVIALNREGNLRWTYAGNPKIKEAKIFTPFFTPCGITTTSAGHIIISDYYAHALHLLSENGDILACKFMDGIGITNPMGLNIDKVGRLWVDCGTGGKGTGAQLHLLNLLI